MRKPFACWLAASSLLGPLGAAHANDTPPIVRVYVAGSPQAVAETRDAVQELCARSNVAVVVHDAAGDDEALLETSSERSLAQAYVDLRPEMPARVVVVDGQTHQELERRKLTPGESLEISVETVAHIVCAAVESSISARAESAKPARVAARAPAHRAPPVHQLEPAPRLGTQVALFGSAEDFGVGFRAGVGAAFSVSRSRGAWRPGLRLSLAAYPQADIASASGTASFESLGARISPMLEWRVASGTSLLVALGIGADRARLQAESEVPGVVTHVTPATFDGVTSALLGLKLKLSRSMGILLGFDADCALSRRRYVVASEQGNLTFFQASRVRPVGLFGLYLSLDGPDDSGSELGASE